MGIASYIDKGFSPHKYDTRAESIAALLALELPKGYYVVHGTEISSIISRLTLVYRSAEPGMLFSEWLHHTIGCYFTNSKDVFTWDDEEFIFKSSKAYHAFLLTWG